MIRCWVYRYNFHLWGYPNPRSCGLPPLEPNIRGFGRTHFCAHFVGNRTRAAEGMEHGDKRNTRSLRGTRHMTHSLDGLTTRGIHAIQKGDYTGLLYVRGYI
jgi:hypothetical protein